MSDYQVRLTQQIAQYGAVENIHDLPQIFHYWSNKFLRPLINEVLGVDSVPEFFGTAFLDAAGRHPSTPTRFLSVGAGDCTVEISVAEWLIAREFTDFHIDCYELSPHLLERGAAQAASKGLSEHIRPVETDINQGSFNGRYHGAMANHSLHHIVELEHLFSNIRECLLPGGSFATNDVIGRNGHMRWPEVLEIIEAFWQLLPHEKRYNHQLRRLEPTFVNFDCSGEGFEGIRAQEVLPLMLKFFRFEKFLGYGGLIDIFIDRSFGHNFSKDSEWDRSVIDFVHMLNERLIDAGTVKPTMMFAVVDLHSAECSFFGNRSPEFSVRRPA